MAFDSNDAGIPRARVRPTTRGARARAMGGDAHRWVAQRALGAGRLVGRVLPPVLAVMMIAGVVIALGISVGHRGRTDSYNFEFDYEQYRVQQQLLDQELKYLQNANYMRQLDLLRGQPYPFDQTAPTLYDPYAVPDLTAPVVEAETTTAE